MGHREWTGQAHIRRAPADAIEAPIRRLTLRWGAMAFQGGRSSIRI
jgi:hypothetical protein